MKKTNASEYVVEKLYKMENEYEILKNKYDELLKEKLEEKVEEKVIDQENLIKIVTEYEVENMTYKYYTRNVPSIYTSDIKKSIENNIYTLEYFKTLLNELENKTFEELNKLAKELKKDSYWDSLSINELCFYKMLEHDTGKLYGLQYSFNRINFYEIDKRTFIKKEDAIKSAKEEFVKETISTINLYIKENNNDQ